MKRCRSCDLEKERDCFNVRRASSDGLMAICKDCHRARAAAERQRNPDGCAEHKRRYIESNRDRIAEDRRAKYATLPDGRRSVIREAALLRYRSRADEARRKNREWKSRNAQRVAEYDRKYRACNPDRIAEIDASRRAAKLSATPVWADRVAIARVFAEAKRLQDETGIRHEVDHIVPLKGRSVCGLHVHWNLRAIPALANRRKSNRLDESVARL